MKSSRKITMETTGPSRETDHTAARLLRSVVAEALGDLRPEVVSVPRSLLLGTADGVGVQAGDLRVVVEVQIGGSESDPSAFIERIGDAFNILGQRAVPGGLAFAAAVPPFVLPGGPETFTVVLRAQRAKLSTPAVPSSAEGERWPTESGHTQSRRHGRLHLRLLDNHGAAG
jgi:hypothetical protein